MSRPMSIPAIPPLTQHPPLKTIEIETLPREYTQKTITIKPLINPRNPDLWLTTRVFNYISKLMQVLYLRTRSGKPRIIIPAISLIFLGLGLALFVFSLISVRRNAVSTIFIVSAILALIVYMATLIGHIIDATKGFSWAQKLSQFDALAFTTYVMLASMAIVFDMSIGYDYQIWILIFTFVGGNICTAFLFVTAFITLIWFPFVVIEFIVRIILCKVNDKPNYQEKITYQTFPYKVGNSSTKECVICFFEYKEGEILCEMKCHKSHVLHENCLIEWLKKQAICPICRAPAYTT